VRCRRRPRQVAPLDSSSTVLLPPTWARARVSGRYHRSRHRMRPCPGGVSTGHYRGAPGRRSLKPGRDGPPVCGDRGGFLRRAFPWRGVGP
jgi:hypothetical protein